MTSDHPHDSEPPVKMKAEDLRAWTDREELIRGITLRIADKRVTALMGPSGCGKSPLLRCLNRMHEMTPGSRVEGRVLLDGADIYAPGTNPAEVRRRVGMVFKKPNPFPHMSVRDNILAGLRLNGLPVERPDELVERSLQKAALWDEVADDLARPGTSLSRGQQQRLCIARALALGPEVLLMDEPTSTLDPVATSRIEDLLHELREHVAVVIVTHNMQQAARVSDYTAFIHEGDLVEFDRTDRIFTNPRERRTEDYVTGKFG
ncbi:phosphate ABC transporter ATP-binding protein [Polyangium mundeleinium]|nr:phosphate ABC transporter ATP-binding protein [Polyangium mundeleinium]